MSKTLFWYIFWQLLKVFALATCSLAGIMCFGGLLRPLTEHGLDLRQVNRMLLYMVPAMSTYSLPVAALFAATIVYGRLSADNELTALRAGGVSYLSLRRFSIALPALVLGLTVAVTSLLMLCFIVPIYSRKVQEVIYSNIAKVIASDIQREHEVNFRAFSGDLHVYADQARLSPPDPANPSLQQVGLIGPAIVTYENPEPNNIPDLRVPHMFWMARSALVTIQRNEDDSSGTAATLYARLTDGIKFPREFYGNVQAGVADTTFGPMEIPPLIHENVKFLNVHRLTELAANPGQGERVQVVLRSLIRREQETTCLQLIAAKINRADSDAYRFPTEGEEGFELGGRGATAQLRGPDLVITAPPHANDRRSVWMRQTHGSQETLYATAKEIHVRAYPVGTKSTVSSQRMAMSIELYDTQLRTQEGPSERSSFVRSFSEPMPAEVRRLFGKTLADFSHDPMITPNDAMVLHHEQVVVNNAARSELHGRASFALSCLILVMVGCALGVMFKSGNFLNAFAVSFVPALLCITLIFGGQQAATHVPYETGMNFHDPLHTALWFIWSGDLAVMATAIYLTIRLQRR